MDSTNRPNPLANALAKVAPIIASLVGIVTGLGSAGVFSVAQVQAVSDYGDAITTAADPSGPLAIAVGAIVGLVTAGSALIGILKAGKGATDHTTPVASPRDVDGSPLVRADGLPLGGNTLGVL